MKNSTMHSLLEKQIQRYLGIESRIPEKLKLFIGAVDQAYRQFDDDREMLERTIELSSQELLQVKLAKQAAGLTL